MCEAAKFVGVIIIVVIVIVPGGKQRPILLRRLLSILYEVRQLGGFNWKCDHLVIMCCCTSTQLSVRQEFSWPDGQSHLW